MNADGSDVRRLTTNPETTASPTGRRDGTDIAYTIDKPDSPVNFEVARMTAAGTRPRPAHDDGDGPGLQPAVVAARRPRDPLSPQRPDGRVSTIWQMGVLGESPALRFAPPQPPLYPSFAPDQRRVAYAGDPLADRRHRPRDLHARRRRQRPDDALRRARAPTTRRRPGRPTARGSRSRATPTSPAPTPSATWRSGSCGADGSRPTQLTRNAAHDEGPAWSPDGRLLAYTSGPDDEHGDIHVMTAARARRCAG